MAPKQDPKPKFQEGLWGKNELAIAWKGAVLLLLLLLLMLLTLLLNLEYSLTLGADGVPLTINSRVIRGIMCTLPQNLTC